MDTDFSEFFLEELPELNFLKPDLTEASWAPDAHPKDFLNIPLKAEPHSPIPTSPSQFTHTISFPNTPLENVGSLRIVEQPQVYQVAKYNIFPAPEIELGQSVTNHQTIGAFLCYQTPDGWKEIKEGFTGGDVQGVKPGQTRVSFPNLHLNLMTPIKSVVQQNGSSTSDVQFCIKFDIGGQSLFSNTFKLVSTVGQIPEGFDNVRPRKPKTQDKKRRKDKPERKTDDDDMYYHVKMKGEETHRGFICLPNGSTLKDAREEIAKSDRYPQDFIFWFEKMQTVVQKFQEEKIKIDDALSGTCLVIEPFDKSLLSVDKSILSLLNQNEQKTIKADQLVRALLDAYPPPSNKYDAEQYTTIVKGIKHFFGNVSKHDYPMVGIDEFKLFLKFFGPPQECLENVFNVYRERFFHGFASHSDAVSSLSGIPGSFLIRYSESQLKEGYFAFNVNKGNQFKDVIENYSIPYNPQLRCFIFRNKKYRTLRDFVTDPEYQHILKVPIEKEKWENRGSKYKLEENLLEGKLSDSFSRMDLGSFE